MLQADWVTDTCDILIYAFNAIWLAEAALKIVAFGWDIYISFAWNRFDLGLVLLGTADCIIVVLLRSGAIDNSSVLESVGGFLRLARLLRLMRVVQGVRSLRMLFHTLVSSLPSLASIAALMLLFFFMYAVLGVQLFYNVRHGDFLTEDANFESLGSALLLLFRCATGESWNGIMHDLSIQQDGHELLSGPLGSAPKLPRCSDTGLSGAGESDCGSFFAVPYFITFTLVGFCVLIQALVAVLLGHFSVSDEEYPIARSSFEDFVYEWSKLDPFASLWVDATQFVSLLKHTDAPLGLKDPSFRDGKRPTLVEGESVLHVMASLHDGMAKLKVHGGQRLMFYEVLMSLATRNFKLPKDHLGPSRFAQAHRAVVRRFMKGALRSRQRKVSNKYKRARSKSFFGKSMKGAKMTAEMARALDSTTVMDVYFATLLQAAAQGYLARQRLKARKQGLSVSSAVQNETSLSRGSMSQPIEANGRVSSSPQAIRVARIDAATIKALEVITIRADAVSADVSSDVAEVTMRRMALSSLIRLHAAKKDADTIPSTPRLGFFISAEPSIEGVPFRWVPCSFHGAGEEGEESVEIVYAVAHMGETDVLDQELVASPRVALRCLRDKLGTWERCCRPNGHDRKCGAAAVTFVETSHSVGHSEPSSTRNESIGRIQPSSREQQICPRSTSDPVQSSAITTAENLQKDGDKSDNQMIRAAVDVPSSLVRDDFESVLAA